MADWDGRGGVEPAVLPGGASAVDEDHWERDPALTPWMRSVRLTRNVPSTSANGDGGIVRFMAGKIVWEKVLLGAQPPRVPGRNPAC